MQSHQQRMSGLKSPQWHCQFAAAAARRAGCFVLLLTVVGGCRSGAQGKVYSYRELPQELVAERRDNAQTIDLSRLASTATNSERIDAGDVLEVTIAAGLNEKDSVKLPVRVNENGVANLPVVGPVPVGGLELTAAEAAITAICIERQLYRSPQITVTMKQQRVNRVTVTGAVEKPGVYELPRGSSDLLAALVAAGGLSEDAGTAVEIRNPASIAEPTGRDTPPIADSEPNGINQAGLNWTPAGRSQGTIQLVSQKVDLVKASKDSGATYRIGDGGVVSVEKRDPEPIHVIGLVLKPNRYDLPVGQDVRVLDAIALAGGSSSPVANKVFVIRRKPKSAETVIVNVTISDAKRDEKANLRLSPGDVVSVEQTPATVVLDALRYINIGIGGSVPLPIF
ncbi:MAG: SLBB domain-containing protein [Planctomycetaceae bacterium]|nr:SLBB domain-containing protein [Planctomycetaceae bacterium]